MKRKKTLVALAIVFAVICAAIVILKGVEKHIDAINTIDEEIINIDISKVTHVSWTYGDTKLSFSKSDALWQNDEDESFPVNQDYMYEFLEHFSKVHASFIINDVKDYDQYGLKNEEACIDFNLEDEGSVSISFGAFSTMDSKRYISIGDGSVYLIDDDLLTYVSTDRDDFIQNDEIDTMDQVISFTVQGDNNVKICFDDENYYTYTDTYNYYLVENGEYKAISGSFARSYINLIKNASLTDYATYNADSVDLAEYGLDNPALTCTIEGEVNKDNEASVTSEVVYIGKTGNEDNQKTYIRVGDSNIIYNIDNSVYESLLNGSYESLRPEEAVSLNTDYMTGLEVSFEGTKYTVSAEKSEDEVKYLINEALVDVTDILSDISDLSLTEISADYEAGVEELELTINQDFNGVKSLKIGLYRYDGDSVVAKLNGEALGLCSRSSMAELREDIAKMILNLGKEELKEE